MPGLAVLSPINEAEEFSPFQRTFRRAHYSPQRSPIVKAPFHHVRDTTGSSPVSTDVTMDDSWIYDCYVSDESYSPGGYPHSPSTSTTSHSRSISLPSTTSSLSPFISVPIVKEPSPHNFHAAPHRASRDAHPLPTSENDYPREAAADGLALPSHILANVATSAFSPDTPAEFPEYSPLEQEAMTIWEVIDELAAAADHFAGLETLLADAAAAARPPALDEDVVFWFVEGLNLLVGDCTEVARDLLQFNEFVEQLLQDEHKVASPQAVSSSIKHASFSEQDSREVLETAASIPSDEIQEALAVLEASVPPPDPKNKRRSRERPPSLKLSTDDAVLIQALRPRSRFESVGAVGRFSDARTETLRKHRAYAVYESETTPIEDNWSTKSIVDYDAIEPMAEIIPQPSLSPIRPRPPSGQSMMPRPMSSPVTTTTTGRLAGRRPPSLALTDPHSEKSSQHSSSSSVSSLFSALPRSSFTTNSSPRTSPRQAVTFDGKPDKTRFPGAPGNFKKMFSNLFKRREGGSARNSLRTFARRTNGGASSVDATPSALALSAMESSSTLTPLALDTEADPFAAAPMSPPLRTPPHVPPPVSPHARSVSEASPLDGYSSLFNPMKAASRFPPQPLFGEPTP
ncbi:hypothetical protein BD413DRAFT_642137 [Trametes elegans]|nr:hypothetical protein BD413DRAFT_642137 [Trametes elegans]